MHLWLDDRLRRAHERRGTAAQRDRPARRRQVDPRHARLHIARAVEGWEPFIWIVSDTRRQACGHLENLKRELETIPSSAPTTLSSPGVAPSGKTAPSSSPAACGSKPTEQASASAPTARRRSPHAHHLRRRAKRFAHGIGRQREHSLLWFEGTLLKAGSKITNVVNWPRPSIATLSPRASIARPVGPRAFSRPSSTGPKGWNCGKSGKRLYSNADDPDRELSARAFYDGARPRELHAGAELLWPEEEDLTR